MNLFAICGKVANKTDKSLHKLLPAPQDHQWLLN